MKKIAIIKLGAKGDVVRTLSLAKGLKEFYKDSTICWITKKSSADLLENNPYIDKVFSLPVEFNEKFDILYNFDIDDEALQTASEIKTDKKYGFYKEGGYPAAYNTGAEYYLNTVFDDELKRNNEKTYQEMMFEAAEIPYTKQYCGISLNEKDLAYAEKFLKENNLDKGNIIGIHIGSSPRWPSKAWNEDRVKEFIEKSTKAGYKVLVFGGPDEAELHKKMSEEFERKGIKVYRNNSSNTNREFASLVNLCSAMVCCDSFALHMSMALGKPTIGLFFCTSPHEVEEYALLRKKVSPLLYDFFPERMDEYSKELTSSISADEVLEAIRNK